MGSRQPPDPRLATPGYAPLMAVQLVQVKDFPGLTVEDAIKIATSRLTQQGYRDIVP